MLALPAGRNKKAAWDVLKAGKNSDSENALPDKKIFQMIGSLEAGAYFFNVFTEAVMIRICTAIDNAQIYSIEFFIQ